MWLHTLQPMDKRMSKIPKAPAAASRPKSIATFKPSTLSVKQASFNFAADGAKGATAKKAPAKPCKGESHPAESVTA